MGTSGGQKSPHIAQSQSKNEPGTAVPMATAEKQEAAATRQVSECGCLGSPESKGIPETGWNQPQPGTERTAQED